MIGAITPVMINAPCVHVCRVTQLPTTLPRMKGSTTERTVLYSIISAHYPRFVQEIEGSGGHLPKFVRQEFGDYLKCGLLEHGFLRVKCDGFRHEHLVAFSCERRGLLRASCPSPFEPACGCSNSPPAILSAPAAGRGAWWSRPLTWSITCSPKCRSVSSS